MDPAEKRKHPRVPLVLQVKYPDQEGYLDATENLSLGGVFVRTEKPFAVGDRVPLALSFPGLLAPLELVGVVAWVRPASEGAPGGVGLEIPEDRAEDRARLAEILARVRADEPGEKAAATPRAYRILLVEDNPHIMEMYAYVMRKLSARGGIAIEMGFAKDGYEALEQLRGQRFDLVVTDLFMPVLDGVEFIRRVRADERTATVPIVAISGGGSDTGALARQAGANIFLRKPVRFTDVIETVWALLRL